MVLFDIFVYINIKTGEWIDKDILGLYLFVNDLREFFADSDNVF